MVLTMRVRFLSCIILSACHGFLLTNKTGTHSVGTNGLTDGHYIILTDALSVQKQLLTQMETFVLQLRNEVKTLNQEVKYLTSGKSAAVEALKNVSAAQLLAVATLQNGSAAQSLAFSGLKNETSELRDKSARLQNSYDSLRKKFDNLQNENGVLKHDYAALKSQISEWNNFSVHIKQELNSFTHSIAASNIQNVTAIQSAMDTLTSKVQSLYSQFNSLSSISTSRSQDFLALLNKTNTAESKLKTIDNWSKSFQNYTDIQLVLLQSHANSSNHRLDSFEQNYAIDSNSTKNRFHSLEQSYASMSSDIRTLKGKVQDMSRPGANFTKHHCKDLINCRPYPRERICPTNSSYYPWANVRCRAYCGICIVNTVPPPCVNKISNCNEYDADLCTNPLYRLFREDNCQLFCGLCKTADAGASPPPPNRRDDEEKDIFFL